MDKAVLQEPPGHGLGLVWPSECRLTTLECILQPPHSGGSGHFSFLHPQILTECLSGSQEVFNRSLLKE